MAAEVDQAVLADLDLVPALQRRGDLTGALRAAELRLALPAPASEHDRVRAELATLRAGYADFSPDGRWIATSGKHGIDLWELDNGRHLGHLDGVPKVKAVSTVTPTYPQTILELPDFATDSTAVVPAPERTYTSSIAWAAPTAIC